MSTLISSFGQRGWYPTDPNSLRQMIQNNGYHSSPSARISAMICPHAGYAYCGEIIGKIMALSMNQKIDHVIIIGPSHYVSLQNKVMIPSPLIINLSWALAK